MKRQSIPNQKMKEVLTSADGEVSVGVRAHLLEQVVGVERVALPELN